MKKLFASAIFLLFSVVSAFADGNMPVVPTDNPAVETN